MPLLLGQRLLQDLGRDGALGQQDLAEKNLVSQSTIDELQDELTYFENRREVTLESQATDARMQEQQLLPGIGLNHAAAEDALPVSGLVIERRGRRAIRSGCRWRIGCLRLVGLSKDQPLGRFAIGRIGRRRLGSSCVRGRPFRGRNVGRGP